MRLRAAIAAALVAGVVAVFAPLRGHDFVDYDDPVWRTQLAAGLSREGLERAVAGEWVGNWIPASALSMLVSRALHGDRAAGYLLGNLALHAASTALLFLLLAATTGAVAPSAFCAAVFGWHPLHVESVAWISQRKDVLCGLFFVLTLSLHARAARRPSRGARAATLAAGLLALLSKPTAVTLPFALVLFDFWPLRRIECSARSGLPTLRGLAGALREQLPLLALAAAIGVVTYRVQAATGALAAPDVLPFGVRAANAIDSLRHYLEHAFWPSGLSVFYPHPVAVESPAAIAATALALALVTALALRAARRAPAAAMGWLWFLGTLVPVLGLVQVGLQARADRYTYLPLIGLAIAVAFPLAQWAAPRATARRALAALGLAAVAAQGVAARAQVGHWRDSLSLYTRAALTAPPNAFASLGLGRALRRAGRGDEAQSYLGLAARLRPSEPLAHLELAELFAERGELDTAIAHQQRAAEQAPDDPRYWLRLAQWLLQAGRAAEAQPALARAQALVLRGARVPRELRAQLALAAARVALAQGDLAAARGALEQARELGLDAPALRAAVEAAARD